MIRTKEVHHLKGDRLLPEVVQMSKHDVELDAPKVHIFFSQDDLVEWRLARAQAAPRDLHPIESARGC